YHSRPLIPKGTHPQAPIPIAISQSFNQSFNQSINQSHPFPSFISKHSTPPTDPAPPGPPDPHAPGPSPAPAPAYASHAAADAAAQTPASPRSDRPYNTPTRSAPSAAGR